MKTIDLANELSELATVNENDLILGYSKSGKRFGFIPLSTVTRGGYACRRWKIGDSSPVGEAYGDVQYLAALPELLGLGCYLVEANHSRRKLDPTNHYKFTTGETAKLDGSMGDYMWGWNTKWFYAWWIEGGYYYEAASLHPIPGKYNYVIPVASMSAVGGIVMDNVNNVARSIINTSEQYRGGYGDDSYSDEKFNTGLGTIATTGSLYADLEYFSNAAHKKGEGWEAGYYAHYAAAGILFRIIFGTRNIQGDVNTTLDANGCYQGGLGEGLTSFERWGAVYSSLPYIQTDYTSQLQDTAITKLGDWSTSLKVGVKVSDTETISLNMAIFFGLQHPFGYINRLESGLMAQCTRATDGTSYTDIYVSKSMYRFSSAEQEDNRFKLDGKVKVATTPTISKGGNYYPTLMSNEALCHVITEVGGSNSTYFCDKTNLRAYKGLYFVERGGDSLSGLDAGLDCANLSLDDDAGNNSCAPLCEAAEDWSTEPILVSADI